MSRAALLSDWEKRLCGKLPPGAEKIIALWIVDLNVNFVISKPRKTKLGDFRPKHDGQRSRISVNTDLNPFHFLITTIHEFAHLGCFLKYGNSVMPHGQEWKNVYKQLLANYTTHNAFPSDLKIAISKHLNNPSASSCSCAILSDALRKYDEAPGTLLHELSEGDAFKFQEYGYEIIQKRRTRFLCARLKDGKKYLISGRAKVEPMVHA